MKLRLAACLLPFSLLVSLLAPVCPARAQEAAGAPPAFAFAQRLRTQAQAAENYADALDAAKDPGNAGLQRDISHRRALQATAKYQEVVSSGTYGHGLWGAEALYQEALVQKDFLHNNATAIQNLQTLHNNYRGVSFPSAGLAAATLTGLESAVDQTNKTTPPWNILYNILDFFVKIFSPFGSYKYALAILAISLLVRLALTPLSNKQFASMREMQKLQPYVKELQAKYKNDKEVLMRKTQELYKKHNVNMFGGCGPMLVQFPILIGLYRMIVLYQYQFVHGKFFWVGSPLSTAFPQVFAPNLGQQDIPLLLLYTASMFVTQKLTVTPSIDPAQAEQQRQMAVMMPLFSGFLFLQWHLPSAFVLYYLIFNVLSTAQQKYYMSRRHADIHGEPEVDKDDDDGGSRKTILLPSGPSNGGSAKRLPTANGAVNGTTGRRPLPGRDVPLAQAKNGTPANGAKSNGATPTAKGIIAPPKVHPKKKRR